MRVRMTRTVQRVTDAGRYETHLIGEDYDLPDGLASVWCAMGVCDPVADSQEAAVAAISGESDASPAKKRGGRDAADQGALTGDEG